MNVLILGGTGAMGKSLTEILLNDSKYSVYITSRSEHSSFSNIKYIICNALVESEITPVLQSCKWDIIIDFMIYKFGDFEKRLGLLLESTNHYFFFSSARVYAESSVPLTENGYRLLDVSNDSEYLSTDEYALAKAREENVIINHEKSNWTIIRPYITYDSYRLQLGIYEKEGWLYRVLNGRSIVIDKNLLDKKTTMTYAFDLAERVAGLFDKDESMGQIYHITTSENHTWNEVIEIYSDVLEKRIGKRPNVVLTDDYNFELNFNPWQSKNDRLFNRVFDNAKINEITKIDTYTSLRDGIDKCIGEFLNNPKFNWINWNVQWRMDKIANERAGWREFDEMKMWVWYLYHRYF